ncbi:MAG: hypothetical protein ACTHL1_07640 [Burkholderiaceae bacterium]
MKLHDFHVPHLSDAHRGKVPPVHSNFYYLLELLLVAVVAVFGSMFLIGELFDLLWH